MSTKTYFRQFFKFYLFPEMIIIVKANVILLDWVNAEVMCVPAPQITMQRCSLDMHHSSIHMRMMAPAMAEWGRGREMEPRSWGPKFLQVFGATKVLS